jgi:hypothetical protein
MLLFIFTLHEIKWGQIRPGKGRESERAMPVSNTDALMGKYEARATGIPTDERVNSEKLS